jgi:1,4-alpha-glucan branching enzyme
MAIRRRRPAVDRQTSNSLPPMKRRGELAIVLHTHMPYVEGFGTWPFGEEWLWEAVASSYLPLRDALAGAPITLSVTPVLCDQLEAPGATERCLSFLEEIRPESHRRDIEALRRQGHDQLVAALERSAAEYAAVAVRLRELDGGLSRLFGDRPTWTSAATHAVLPLVASDSGIGLQVQTGIASHRRRFGEWAGGFWLPECAYAPWLDSLLEEAGVRGSCVELTRDFGLGDARHLRPLETDEGPVLWPIDRETIALVWSEGGYPGAGAYRDYHELTPHHHRALSNDGRPYDDERARALARDHARDFVGRVRERLDRVGDDDSVCVCALDTELLGHWWYEGVEWLQAVLDESARQHLSLTTLDDALTRHDHPVPAPGDLGVSSWGEGGDLRTWSGPAVADMAWRARTAELDVLAARERATARALRELLALQASDWAFLATRELAGDYPRERTTAHAAAIERALAAGPSLAPELRNLAPELSGWEG